MGFIGRLRGWILKSFEGGVNTVKASEAIVSDARKTVTSVDIGSLFTTKYLREVDNVPHLGREPLFDFVAMSRRGNYAQSFGTAFEGVSALNNRQVRRVINDLLLDARQTLPDYRLARDIDEVEALRKLYGIDTAKITNAKELESTVNGNARLKSDVDRLVRSTGKTKTLKFLGYTAVIAAGTVTAAAIYSKLEQLAKEQTGCFAYWMDNTGRVRRCKVGSYSCASPDTDTPCLSSLLPDSILNNADCTKADNKTKDCIHCDNTDVANKDLPENVTLRCEKKTAGDLLLDTISNTITRATGIFGGWIQWLVIIGVAIVCIVIVFALVSRL